VHSQLPHLILHKKLNFLGESFRLTSSGIGPKFDLPVSPNPRFDPRLLRPPISESKESSTEKSGPSESKNDNKDKTGPKIPDGILRI